MLEAVPGPREPGEPVACADGTRPERETDDRPTGFTGEDADFFHSVLDNLYDGIYFVDRQRRVTYWNRGAERITGYSAEQMVGSRCADGLLNHVDDSGRHLCGARCPLLATMRDGGPREAHVFLHHVDGHRLPVLVRAAPMYRAGELIGAVETFSDNSTLIAALRQVNELTDVAVRDPLTGVGNRRFADAQVRVALTQATEQARLSADEASGLRTGVLFVDLDHFKKINDRHGHLVGDQVLAMVARTLTANLRPSDTVARWGGEEFIAIIPFIDPNRLLSEAEHVRRLVSNAALIVEDDAVEVTVSVGATLIREGDTKESLVARVDQLLYQSKENGRNRVSSDHERTDGVEEEPVPTGRHSR